MDYIVGQDGLDYLVLKNIGETYKVIAKCPSRDYAEAIVEAFDLAGNPREIRRSWNEV